MKSLHDYNYCSRKETFFDSRAWKTISKTKGSNIFIEHFQSSKTPDILTLKTKWLEVPDQLQSMDWPPICLLTEII